MNRKRVAATTLYVIAALVALSGRGVLAADFEPHGYVLVSVGDADAERRLSDVDVIVGDDSAFEIGAGFAFNPYLSVEASYQDFGEPDGFAGCPIDVLCIAIVPFARENVEVDGWAVALRGALPITDSLSVFARVGFLSWDFSARTPALNADGTDLLYGIGLATDLGGRFGLQISYEEAEVDIETIKLGLRVRL